MNAKFIDAATVAMSETSSAIEFEHLLLADVTATITGANPSNTTFDTGTMAVETWTFPAKASATDGDYIAFYDAAGLRWAVALDTTGGAAQTPTGAIWTAIPAGRKVYADISADTTAAEVAARVETAINALTGFTAAFTTDDTAANGTMIVTRDVPGVLTGAAAPKSYDDAGAGSITSVTTTAGVATDVDITNNQVTIPSHGYLTGMKISGITTTGTLPAALSLLTVYYVIKVDANTIKFATSQANALAGTAVDLTDYGATTSVNTVTVATALAGSIKLQKNNEPDGTGIDPIWVDLDDDEVLNSTNSQSYAAAGNLNWVLREMAMRELRCVVTNTSGTVTVSVRVNSKGM